MQLSLRDLSLGQHIERLKVERSIDFGLIVQLYQCLIILEGSNLGPELHVKLPQCLLFADDILEVESCLLSIMICLGLLLFHLLFHVGDNLKELVFMLLAGVL